MTAEVKEVKDFGWDQPGALPNSTVHIFTVPPPLTGTATASTAMIQDIKYPPEFEFLTEAEKNTVKNFFYEVRTGKMYPVIAGAFGDMVDCDGIVKQRIFPPEGGQLTEMWGSSFYFKGYPEKHVVEGAGLAKAMMSQIPREIVVKQWPWKLFLAFLFIFARRTFIHSLHVWFKIMHGHTVLKFNIPTQRYNNAVRELKRAGDETVKKMLDNMGNKKDVPYSWAYTNLLYPREYQKRSPREFWEFIVCVLDFAWLFIESDNAYRFRVQDVLPLLNKDNVKKNAVKEINRLLNILIERENPVCGIKYKWIAIKKLAIPFLYLSRNARNFAREFLLELNLDKIKMDENDYYFSLRRHTFMFRGIPTHKRIEEAYKIDQEKGIVRFQLILVKDPQGNQVPAIKVVRGT